MGIEGFNPFIKQKCPEAFINLPYSFFKGKRVAWDGDNIFRKLMARAHKEIVYKTDVCSQELNRDQIVETWLKHCKYEIFKWLNFGITPVFIFDGQYIDAKSATQEKRRKERRKRTQRAKDYKDYVYSLDALERTPQMLQELRKNMAYLGTIKSEEKDLLMGIIEAAGLPLLIATEEGEKLAAMLCVEGKVDGVYTMDTDVMVMGCPLKITEDGGYAYNPNSGRTEQILSCMRFKPILSALNMSYESFVDLCIMAGCDFNGNIKRCAIKTAYKILSKCDNIENLPLKYAEKSEILNHHQCRDIFKIENAYNICQGDLILDVNRDLSDVRDRLEMFNAADWIPLLQQVYKFLPKPSNVCISKKPSYKKSSLKLNIVKKENKQEKTETELVDEIENILNTKNYLPLSQPSPKKDKKKNPVKSLSFKQLENYKTRMNSKKININILS